jgi:hypothetical protein
MARYLSEIGSNVPLSAHASQQPRPRQDSWPRPAAAILIVALYLNVSFAQELPPVLSVSPSAQKIREKVRKIGVGQLVTMIQKKGW